MSDNQQQERNSPPDLYFPGSPRKNNGATLFIDFIWWLPRYLYKNVFFLADEFPIDELYENSLKHAASARGIEYQIIAFKDQTDLQTLFLKQVVFIQPAATSSVNPFLLQALLQGCPIVIHQQSKLTKILHENCPFIPIVSIPLDYERTAVLQITALLTHYENYRNYLKEILLNHTLPTEFNLLQNFNFQENKLEKIPSVLSQAKLSKAHTPIVQRAIKSTRRRMLNCIGLEKPIQAQLHNFRSRNKQLAELAKIDENNRSNIDKKITAITALIRSTFIDRVRLYKLLAHLELKRDNHLTAVSHMLKIMKCLGKDHWQDLPFVIKTLNERGYQQEANVANAMFNLKNDTFIECQNLLNNARLLNLNLTTHQQYEIIDNRRAELIPKVTIVVTFYQNPKQFHIFVKMIKQQTLFRFQLLEIIFIDNHSPTKEYRIFTQTIQSDPFSALYIRTSHIQSTYALWNQALNFARGDYLIYMDINDIMRPIGLEQLAAELDSNLDIDWVVANSIGINVDETDVYQDDKMLFNRQGYHQSRFYLDCHYLCHRAGLYRRSIHQRYGYYDESFKQAGNKEFISRILPFVKIKQVAIAVNAFKMVDTCKINDLQEIENLRALELHKTVAGIHYGNLTINSMKTLFTDALSHHKCYAYHDRTDFNFALNLAIYLSKYQKIAEYQNQVLNLQQIISIIHSLEYVPSKYIIQLIKKLYDVTRIEKRQRKHLPSGNKFLYNIFSDVRYPNEFDTMFA